MKALTYGSALKFEMKANADATMAELLLSCNSVDAIATSAKVF